jgi:hypothetical protein
MPTIHECIEKLVSAGLISTGQVVGCSDSEILRIESFVNSTLPKAYKEFLKAMGQVAGDFLSGTDVFMSKLPNLRAWAETLLSSTNSAFRLSPDMFVFLVHQGYQFVFFHLNQDDDPPVYGFVEGDDLPHMIFGHFTEWLAASVDDEIAAYRDIQEN